MKKLLLPMLMLIAALGASAAGTALKVSFIDGKSVTYVLSEKPKVTFSGDNMNIVSSTASTSYQRSEISSITFVQAQSAISDIQANNTTYSFIDNVFESQGSEISVFSVRGSMVAHGVNSLSLESLQSGIYIVKAGNQSIKICKN